MLFEKTQSDPHCTSATQQYCENQLWQNSCKKQKMEPFSYIGSETYPWQRVYFTILHAPFSWLFCLTAARAPRYGALLLFLLLNIKYPSFSPPVPEEPKEPVDPAVRAKENWLRLYNKVLDQLREVNSLISFLLPYFHHLSFQFSDSVPSSVGLIHFQTII